MLTDLRLRRETLIACGVPAGRMEEVLAWTGKGIPVRARDLVLPPLAEEPLASFWRGELAVCPEPADQWRLFTACHPTLLHSVSEFPWADAWAMPEGFSLEMASVLGAALPVAIVPRRQDFVRVLGALAFRGRVAMIPESQSAFYISGLTNAKRLHLASESHAQSEAASLPKDSWQDRLIILTEGGYAGLDHECMGMSATAWHARSLVLRRAHEMTHHALHRMRGQLSHNLAEEVAADYEGCLAAGLEGSAAMMQRLFGMGAHAGEGRGAGRLGGYLPFSLADLHECFAQLVISATRSLETLHFSTRTVAWRHAAWCLFTLEELAHPEVELQLQLRMRDLEARLQSGSPDLSKEIDYLD